MSGKTKKFFIFYRGLFSMKDDLELTLSTPDDTISPAPYV